MRAFRWLEMIITVAVVLALILMVALIGSQVGARYIFNRPLPWTEELGRHLMVWMVFLGATIAYRRGYHLSIDFLRERLPLVGQHLFQAFCLLVLGLFFFLMIQHGWRITQGTMVQRSSALGYPIGYAYASLPVSGLLFFIFNVERAIILVRRIMGKHPQAGEEN